MIKTLLTITCYALSLYLLFCAALALSVWKEPLGTLFAALSLIFVALYCIHKETPEPTLKEKLFNLARKALFIR